MEVMICVIPHQERIDKSYAVRPKRGDVICVQPDDWPWGSDELGDPKFAVVKLIGKPAELARLVERADDGHGQTRWYRKHYVDLDALGFALRGKVTLSKDQAAIFLSAVRSRDDKMVEVK